MCQANLLKSSILVIGAGGLGSPALLYLAAYRVGRIGIVDHDILELNDLQRHVLFVDSLQLQWRSMLSIPISNSSTHKFLSEMCRKWSTESGSNFVEGHCSAKLVEIMQY
ncbi:hypothetical protein P3S67_021383 [Capsicum chacoense]